MYEIQSLPKDIIMFIMRKFDIDTRIKAGVIGKLKIPEMLQNNIARSLAYLKPIPQWILGEKPHLLSQAIAVRLPLSNNKRYELYYQGGGFWFADENKIALLHATHVCEQTVGFPDIKGLPQDFVEMHLDWVVKYDHPNPFVEYFVLKQPGALYKSHSRESVNENANNALTNAM